MTFNFLPRACGVLPSTNDVYQMLLYSDFHESCFSMLPPACAPSACDVSGRWIFQIDSIVNASESGISRFSKDGPSSNPR